MKKKNLPKVNSEDIGVGSMFAAWQKKHGKEEKRILEKKNPSQYEQNQHGKAEGVSAETSVV